MSQSSPLPFRRRLLCTALMLGALAPTASLAADPAWPTKSIRIVVGFAPGGGTDLMARIVGQALGEIVGQSVIVENKPGGSGNIAASDVIRAPADGYTIYIAPTTVQSANPSLFKSNPVNLARDLVPLAGIGRMQLHLIVRPGLAVKDLGELMAMARANPGKLTYASSGAGTTPHLIGEVFLQQTGLDIRHIPYRGAGPSLQAVLASETDIALDPGIAFQHVRAGKVRMLAVASGRRSPAFPDVPTFGESGVAGLDLDTWFGAWVPAGTPPDVMAKLDQAFAKALEQPNVRQRFSEIIAEAAFLNQTDFRAMLDKETRVLAQVIKERKINVE